MKHARGQRWVTSLTLPPLPPTRVWAQFALAGLQDEATHDYRSLVVYPNPNVFLVVYFPSKLARLSQLRKIARFAKLYLCRS